MDFDRTDNGREFAQVYPVMNGETGNRALRTAAAEAGNKDMVGWVRPNEAEKTIEWRLYKDQVPAGLDVDKAFGKFVTPEAKEASLKESAEFQARHALTAGVTAAPRGQNIPEEDRLYPHASVKAEYDRRKAVAEKDGVVLKYSSDAGTHYRAAGTLPEHFKEFQTPEAKKQWSAEAELTTQQRRQLAREADKVIDATKERAAGRVFVADNATGFKLPDPNSKDPQEKKVFESQMKGLTGTHTSGPKKGERIAPDIEVSRVHRRTKDAVDELRDKQFSIRLNKALDLNAEKGLTPSEFVDAGKRKQDAEGRWEGRFEGEKRQRSLAGGAGLGPTEFATLVSLERGYSAIRKEALERGLIAERSNTRGKSAERGVEQEQSKAPVEQSKAPEQSKAVEQSKAPDKALETVGAETPAAETKTRAKGKRGWANAMAQGIDQGR